MENYIQENVTIEHLRFDRIWTRFLDLSSYEWTLAVRLRKSMAEYKSEDLCERDRLHISSSIIIMISAKIRALLQQSTDTFPNDYHNNRSCAALSSRFLQHRRFYLWVVWSRCVFRYAVTILELLDSIDHHSMSNASIKLSLCLKI